MSSHGPLAGGTTKCPPLLSSLGLSVYLLRKKEATTGLEVNPSCIHYGLCAPGVLSQGHTAHNGYSWGLYSCIE